MTRFTLKSLIAIAGLTAAAGAQAFAINDYGTPGAPSTAQVSRQGFEGVASYAIATKSLVTTTAPTSVAGDFTLTLGAQYNAGDIITLTFNAPVVTTPAFSNLVLGRNASAGLAADEVGSGDCVAGFLDATGSTVRFRVSNNAPACTVGTVLSIGQVNAAGTSFVAPGQNIRLQGAALRTAGSLAVTVGVTNNAGLGIDTTAMNSSTLATLANQFAAGMNTDFDGVIDVNAQRKRFVAGGVNVDEDAATINTVNPVVTTPALVGLASPTASKFVITGDFGFMDDDANGVVSDTERTAAATFNPVTAAAANRVVDLAARTLTLTYATFTPSVIVTLSNAQTGTIKELNATSWTYAHEISYTNNAVFFGGPTNTAVAAPFQIAGSLGAWALNGYQAVVPYMPFGDAISQVLYLSNRGTLGGAITLDVIGLDGPVLTGASIGMIGANRTANIGLAVRDAIQAASPAALASGRLALIITANIPQANGALNAAYVVNGNRNAVEVLDNCNASTKSGNSITSSCLRK